MGGAKIWSILYSYPLKKNTTFLYLCFSFSKSSSIVSGISLSSGFASLALILYGKLLKFSVLTGGLIGKLVPSFLGTTPEGHQNVHSCSSNTREKFVSMPKSKGLGFSWLSFFLIVKVPFIRSSFVTFLAVYKMQVHASPNMASESPKAVSMSTNQAATALSGIFFTPVALIST